MTMTATTRIRVSFDPQADMRAIDRADEADDFAGAWLGAIRGLAQALGLDDCEGFRAPAGSPAEADGCTVTEIAGDEGTVEAVLWQAAHDLCERDAEAAAGDRWQWSEPSAQTVERLRRRLRLAAIADQEDSTTDAIRISSAKGKFKGTIEQAAAWLATTQPAFPSVDTEDGNAEIRVEGTPGASIYRRAIEAALAGTTAAELDAIEAEGYEDGVEAVAEAVREQDSLAREEEREADGAAEVAGWNADGWDAPAVNAGAHAMAKSMEGHEDSEAARKAYYAAYDRGAREAQQALSAEKAR